MPIDLDILVEINWTGSFQLRYRRCKCLKVSYLDSFYATFSDFPCEVFITVENSYMRLVRENQH